MIVCKAIMPFIERRDMQLVNASLAEFLLPSQEQALACLQTLHSVWESPGGISMNRAVVADLYARANHLTFPMIVAKLLLQTAPNLYSLREEGKLERTPGLVMAGFFLDLLKILNPERITYEEGVRLTFEAIAGLSQIETPFVNNHGLPGWQIANYHLVLGRWFGLAHTVPDRLMNRLAARRFKDTYIEVGQEWGRSHFRFGYQDMALNHIPLIVPAENHSH